MIVVSNATPIISLASIGKVELLQQLFHHILIPEAVYKEIKSKKATGFSEIDADFFEKKSIKGNTYLGFLLNELDRGEAETILLAKEINADILIMDERIGRKIAKTQDLFVIGTLSVLVMAKEKGFISVVKPILEEMIEKGRWYSRKVYQDFLKAIGE